LSNLRYPFECLYLWPIVQTIYRQSKYFQCSKFFQFLHWFSKTHHLCRFGVLIFALFLEMTNITFFDFNFSFSIKTPYGQVFLKLSYICDCECEKKENKVRLFNCSRTRVQLHLWKWELIIDTDMKQKKSIWLSWRTREKIFCYLWLIFLFSSRAEWRYLSVNKSTQKY